MRKLIGFFLLINQGLLGVVGWLGPKTVTRGILDHDIYQGVSGDQKLYLVTTKLVGQFRKNQKTKIAIYARTLSKSGLNKRKVATVVLAKSPTLFPLNPTIAGYKNEILVAWQETNLATGGTLIRYAFSSSGIDSFQAAQILPGTESSGIALLPQVKADQSGKFHIFFQKEQSESRFTLQHSIGVNGTFAEPKSVVSDLKTIGRGVFFPSVLIAGNKVDIIYQNRLEQNWKDELFRAQSFNGGITFVKPEKLTNNSFNDFSPHVISVNSNLEWVWQANPAKTWEIYYGGEYIARRKLSNTNAHAYQPSMVNNPKAGRVAVWHDTRNKAVQVYGIFLDKDKRFETAREHNISNSTRGARKPVLISWREQVLLFYRAAGALIYRKADMQTGKIEIKSKVRIVKGRQKVTFSWKLPKDPSGVDGFAYVIDTKAKSDPLIFNLSAKKRSVFFENMLGNKYFFHIRYRDKAGNISRVYSKGFVVDSTAPQAPEINSPTHRENVPTAKSDVRLDFTAEDDSGIGLYQYNFSTHRGAKLKKKTKKSTITFKNQLPGTYYFMVRAIDYAGNKSPISIYQVEISPSDANETLIATNIADGQIFEKKLAVSVRSQKKVKSAYLFVGPKKVDPFKKKYKFELKQSKNTLRLNRLVQNLPAGLYTVSLGLELKNGEKIERHFFFEKVSKDKRGPSVEKLGGISTDKEDGFSKISKSKKVRKPERGRLKAEIKLKKKKNLFEVYFRPPKTDQFKRLKGYSWMLTGARSPRRPGKLINSVGGPEYIYNLKPGDYYLSVKPVYSDKVSNRAAKYSYIRFSVADDSLISGMKWWLLGLGIFVLATLGVILSFDKIRFYLRLK